MSATISSILLSEFQSLFIGNTKAYGSFIYGNITDNGEKVKGKAFTVANPVTVENYQEHLLGEKGLGIIPIDSGDNAQFGVIDIDDYDINAEEIIDNINKLNLPLVPFRSKSGGMHIYIFFHTKIPAKIMQNVLFYMSTALGFKKVELFPKQTTLVNTNVGNWINLPYYNYEDTKQYAFDSTGKPLLLEEAIDYIKTKQVDVTGIDELISQLPYQDAPPCLQYLLASGNIESNRNIFLFNVAVYLKLKFGEEFEKELLDINYKLENPLDLEEVNKTIISSIKRKEYFYTCSQSPLCDCCNKAVCKERQYGIESDIMPDVIIGTLKKIQTIPPLWVLNIDGIDVELNTQELLDQRSYQRICVENIHKFPKLLKNEQWRKIVQTRLQSIELVEAPEEASTIGMFKEYLREFCTERVPAHTVEQIHMKRVFTDDIYHYFKGQDFYEYLTKNKGFIKYSVQQVYSKIRDIGGGPDKVNFSREEIIEDQDENGDAIRTKKSKACQIRVYKIPKFDVYTFAEEDLDFSKFEEEPY